MARFWLVAVLAAVGCGDDVHDFGTCGASYAGVANPAACEAACQEIEPETGPGCTPASCVEHEYKPGVSACAPNEAMGVGGCTGTKVVDGVRGCCSYFGRSAAVFFECED